MIRNYLKIAFRNLERHKAFSFINITGLAIGIASCLLLFTVVKYELSYDGFQPGYDQIYRVVTEEKKSDGTLYTPGVPFPALDALRIDIPEITAGALLSSNGSQVTVQGTKTKEVGIRKVLGASAGNIVYLSSKEFTILISIAFVIAAPLAYFMTSSWLLDFVYRIKPGVGVFVIAVFISIIISWITVGYNAIKVAVANPVEGLRTE